MKPETKSLDLQRIRETLVGPDGAGGVLPVYLQIVKDTGLSASPNSAVIMMFSAIVDGYVTGLEQAVQPLLKLTQRQLREVIERGRLPADAGQRALLYEHAALLTWMAEGRDDQRLSDQALDDYEAYMREAYVDPGRSTDTMTLDAYMRFAIQAGQGVRAARFFEVAAAEDAAKVGGGTVGSSERAVAYAIASEIPGASESAEKLVRRGVDKWLGGSMRRAAVCWLKFLRWRPDGSVPVAKVLRRAESDLPTP